MSEYPEHDKMMAAYSLHEMTQRMINYLDDANPYHLVRDHHYEGYEPEMIPLSPRETVNLLAKIFDIDLNKVEDEKRAMLARFRRLQYKQQP